MLYAFFALRASFFTTMNTLIMSLLQLSVMRVHFGRLDDVLGEAPERASEGVHIARVIRRGVALEDLAVQFGAGQAPLIAGVNLEIDVAGRETLAIIGPSGCGKSSLLRILASLHPAQTGRVLVDGRALDAFGVHEYRANIGCVFADDQLFAGTVAENVALYAPDVTQAQIETVLAEVGLLEAVEGLPQGFATLLSNESPLLSTGQRRRLILARALCRRPRLLLLDEVTANLDPASEAELVQALLRFPAAKVFVTHSRHVLPYADRVLTVSGGALVEVRPDAAAAA